MHKFLFNTLELDLLISPAGPILIKSGVEPTNPILPDMNFVRGSHPYDNGKPTIYLPGSSLKGVIRSHAERIIRTVGKNCCDPLSKTACGDRLDKRTEASGGEIYRELCLACRTFGHTVMASHFIISDAYPFRIRDGVLHGEAIDTLSSRQMVAIDRRSGGSVNTFNMETATQGDFFTRIVFHNFERWQIGLLALVLRDLDEGRVRIGFGKSRGLGEVRVQKVQAKLIYPDTGDDRTLMQHIYGVGELAKSAVREEYGFQHLSPEKEKVHILAADDVNKDWGLTELSLTKPDAIDHLLKSQVPAWKHYTQQH